MQQKPFQYQPPADLGLDILFEDKYLLILNKPSGLLSVPGRGDDRLDSLATRLQKEFPEALVVHRLDMATSGMMLFARNKEAHRAMSMAFAERKIEKTYIAVLDGLLQSLEGKVDQPLMTDWDNRPRQKVDLEHGKPSITLYQVLSQDIKKQTTRVLLTPITGRSHQLRVHMQCLGHAIVGDEFYADNEGQKKASRLLLHASEISFEHPMTQQIIHIQHKPDF